MHAFMDALDGHLTMSTHALGSEWVRGGLRDILLGPAQLYEALQNKSVTQHPGLRTEVKEHKM